MTSARLGPPARRTLSFAALFSLALLCVAALHPLRDDGIGTRNYLVRPPIQALHFQPHAAPLPPLPLLFIPNQGQLDSHVALYIQGRDKTVFFTETGVTFALGTADDRSPAGDFSESRLTAATDKPSPHATAVDGQPSAVIHLDFVGAQRVRPEGLIPAEARISLFLGDTSQWRVGLPTYHEIIYPNLWPGIDLVYAGTSQQLKYTFHVHPGADPTQVRLAYRGADSLAINAQGELAIGTPVGLLHDAAPVSYQDIDGQRVAVATAYEVLRSAASPQHSALTTQHFEYGFRLGAYDPTQPLVVDPALLVYAGFIGGSAVDAGTAIAVDATGAAYVTGYTGSAAPTFPELGGPVLFHNGGSLDAFVAKVDPNGGRLIYAGFIGGRMNDYATAIAVDAQGAAYITGYTTSDAASFPVVGGPSTTYKGGMDAFVAKIKPDGSDLVYAGYIGGTGADSGTGIAVDRTGAAYITGNTTSPSTTFPLAEGPDLAQNGGDDAFVAKVKPDGSGLQYAGYIGGSSTEQAAGIAVDSAGAAYVTGYTKSDNFPVAGGPYRTRAGLNDVFVSKVQPDGRSLAYSGYLGGSGNDQGLAIAVDSTGAAYVTGVTSSDNFPTRGGLDPSFNGGSPPATDAFITKIRPDGLDLVYSGYIGGAGNEQGAGIAVDGQGNAYIVGSTTSSQGFPLLAGPDMSYGGGGDAFVVKVRADGESVVYASYIGGTDEDYGLGIAVDSTGAAYVTGYTGSTIGSFPSLVGPALANSGGLDGFVAKISASDGNTVVANTVVQGKVTLQGRSNHSGILITTPFGTTQTTTSGDFSIELPRGRHTVLAGHALYLSRTTTVDVTSPTPITLPQTFLFGGDTDTNGSIGVGDLTRVGLHYGTAPPADPLADINADGRVDLYDLIPVSANFGLFGPKGWTEPANKDGGGAATDELTRRLTDLAERAPDAATAQRWLLDEIQRWIEVSDK